MIKANDLVDAIQTDKKNNAGIPGFGLIFSVDDFDFDWASLLYDVREKVNDEDISKLLRALWCMNTRGIDKSKALYLHKKYGMNSMLEKDKAFYDKLPNPITVYRAGGEKGAGLSWSCSKEVAMGFAGYNPALVVQTSVSKDKVLAAYDAGEQEIIFDAFDN